MVLGHKLTVLVTDRLSDYKLRCKLIGLLENDRVDLIVGIQIVIMAQVKNFHVNVLAVGENCTDYLEEGDSCSKIASNCLEVRSAFNSLAAT